MSSHSLRLNERKYIDSLSPLKDNNNNNPINLFITPRVICETH